MSEPTFIDRLNLLRRVDGDTEMLQELIEIFFTSYPQQLSEIEEALQIKDYVTAETTAHSLKASLQTFFKGSLCQKALECEHAAADEDPDALQRSLDSLKAEFIASEEVFTELREFLD